MLFKGVNYSVLSEPPTTDNGGQDQAVRLQRKKLFQWEGCIALMLAMFASENQHFGGKDFPMKIGKTPLKFPFLGSKCLCFMRVC